MKKLNTSNCRHRGSWLLAGGIIEWCYECGAWRKMTERGMAQVDVASPWCYPSGVGSENPWGEWDARRRTWLARNRRPA